MPTLDMALFDWTDYEDLKPEVWPSAKKKGMSTYPTTPVLGLPASLLHHWSAQPDLQILQVVGQGIESIREWTPQMEMLLSRAYHIPNTFILL